MEQHENFSPQQSLRLIESMIAKTKANLSDNRFYFLLWGWVAFAGIMGQFILKVVFQYRHHYIIWLITFVAVFISILHGKKNRNKTKVQTYIGANMSYLWTGMGISFFILCFILTFMPAERTGWLVSYPFFILLYGLGTFVSGKLLQFKPLIIGGIINWFLACIAVFFSFDFQMLFAAVAVVASYIIPGYLLKPKNSQNAQR